MEPVFQTAQNICFDTILRLYGQDATWKAPGQQDVSETVLFNDPTKAQRMQLVNGRGLSHVAYDNSDIVSPYIEFRENQFVGLYDKVMQGVENQYIETGGVLYVCKHVLAKFDGQTYQIQLQPSDPGVNIFTV